MSRQTPTPRGTLSHQRIQVPTDYLYPAAMLRTRCLLQTAAAMLEKCPSLQRSVKASACRSKPCSGSSRMNVWRSGLQASELSTAVVRRSDLFSSKSVLYESCLIVLKVVEYTLELLETKHQDKRRRNRKQLLNWPDWRALPEPETMLESGVPRMSPNMTQ